jgi:acyl dehydratase
VLIDKKDTKEGQQFSGNPKKISWERIWTFSGGPFKRSGWPSSNVHTDLEFAKDCGLPTVAASATQYQGYVVQLMISLFGFEWLSHGTMDVKFIRIVDAGDILVPKAVVRSKEIEGSTTKFTLEVWIENQRGEKVLVGYSTGIR